MAYPYDYSPSPSPDPSPSPSEPPSADDPSLPLPRILCLHGGGVNARVFRWQCRSIIRSGLSSHFRFVFADGPFGCPPHPAIVPVYGSYGPFYRWLRWMEEHEEVDAETVSSAVLSSLQNCMDDDPGTGEWVGVLGFSQGAKIAGSLLWTQERVKKLSPASSKAGLNSWRGLGQHEALLRDKDRGKAVDWKFGVLMAGSAPTVMLDPVGKLRVPRYVETADKSSMAYNDWPPNPSSWAMVEEEGEEPEHVITLPTLHVHGLQDPGIERHRKLLELYCKSGTTRLVEWQGDHRLPIKMVDVDPIVGRVLEMGWEMGVL